MLLLPDGLEYMDMNRTEPPQKAVPADGTSRVDTAVSLLALMLIGLIGWLSFTLSPAAPAAVKSGLAPREMAVCVMDNDGYLRGELYGSVRQTLDWLGADMACDGMPKPAGEGVRLAFREHADPDTPGLMFVIGIEGVKAGQPFAEQAANVTLNDQPGGRFFSTQGKENCWVSMIELIKLTGTVNDIWRLDGLLYCTAALAAAAGTGSVTLGELQFSGQIRLEAE
jgi:hypothetical protein